MHTLTVTTRYGFGENVKFDSWRQKYKGTGKIIAITIWDDKSYEYTLEICKGGCDYDYQPGICEDEIIAVVPAEGEGGNGR